MEFPIRRDFDLAKIQEPPERVAHRSIVEAVGREEFHEILWGVCAPFLAQELHDGSSRGLWIFGNGGVDRSQREAREEHSMRECVEGLLVIEEGFECRAAEAALLKRSSECQSIRVRDNRFKGSQ